MRRSRLLAATATAMLVAGGLLAVATWHDLMPLPATLREAPTGRVQQVLAADGTPLSRSYGGRFNTTATLPLWQVPSRIRHAFLVSEDKRYWHHGGADWTARLNALRANIRYGHVVRGASTIGEQVARILKLRPRTYWSHWMAGFDAALLLHRFGHAAVFEFYLNQVPYGARRRGIVPAARYYFGRDPAALDPAEQLALAVLIRSPGRYDPRAHPKTLRHAVDQLARRMRAQGATDTIGEKAILESPITPAHRPLRVDAAPFVVYARRREKALGLHEDEIRTTLDPSLQRFVQGVLRQRLADLHARGARNAAALVVDNASGKVLAWAVAPAGNGLGLDPVLAPRQPGSTLKPFVYGLAMERLGWQPDHVLEDTSLAEPVRLGVHRYRNYSGRHYGRVSLRYALANSLNIPAVRTAQAVGVPAIVHLLQRLGFTGLDRSADHYGPAIVLGDGAVPLFDLVQGYASLARHGRFLPLRVLADAPPEPAVRVLSPQVTSVLASILSDPDARSAEFGTDSVLDLPEPTAVKTGTSSDYRDAWSVGFDNRYAVGVWIGRLKGGVTDRLTGSNAPAPVLRQIFARLRTNAPYAGLWQSRQLRQVPACEWMGPPPCIRRMEWRLGRPTSPTVARAGLSIVEPVRGEVFAIDPRIPRTHQRLQLRIEVTHAVLARVRWRIDGNLVADSRGLAASWRLRPGMHRVDVVVWLKGKHAPRRITGPHFEVLGPAGKARQANHPQEPAVPVATSGH